MWVPLVLATFISLVVSDSSPMTIAYDEDSWDYSTEPAPTATTQDLYTVSTVTPSLSPKARELLTIISPRLPDPEHMDTKIALIRLERTLRETNDYLDRNLDKINERFEAIETFIRTIVTKNPEILSCDEGWMLYQNRCMLISDDKVSFGEAELLCASLGSQLVKIEDEQHWAFIRQVLSESAWIGLSDHQEEGVFRWSSDGTITTFLKWGDGEAELYDDAEDCVMLHKGKQYKFADVSCSAEHHYICERDPTFKKQRCPEGTEYAAGFCYHVSGETGNWQTGIKYCKGKGLSYAKVITKAQWKVLSENIRGFAWIGLSDLEKEGLFVWQSDGSQAFTPWSEENPDGSRGSQKCVQFQHSSAYLWNDRTCSNKAHSLCETKQDDGKCPDGFKKFQSSCYFLNEGKAHWFFSKNACAAMGTYLAKISTEEEHQFVTEEMLSEDTWFGLSDMDGDGEFKWTKDGENLFGNLWHHADPNNHENLEHCVLMGSPWKYQLVDSKCSKAYKFVCTTQPIID